MSDNEITFFKRQLDKIEKFWFILIFGMALSFLAALDQLFILSDVLSRVLEEWRSLLHWVWEFLINAPLKLIGKGPIDIPSPWPEFLTFISMLIFTSFKKEKIEDTKWSKFLLEKNYAITDFFLHKSDSANSFFIGIFIFVLGGLLGLFLLFAPYVAVGYILLATSSSTEYTQLLILIPIIVMLSIGYSMPSKYDKVSEIIELHGYVVIPLVILCALIFVVFVSAFETIISSIWAFVEVA